MVEHCVSSAKYISIFRLYFFLPVAVYPGNCIHGLFALLMQCSTNAMQCFIQSFWIKASKCKNVNVKLLILHCYCQSPVPPCLVFPSLLCPYIVIPVPSTFFDLISSQLCLIYSFTCFCSSVDFPVFLCLGFPRV